jgi:hypothetical protein
MFFEEDFMNIEKLVELKNAGIIQIASVVAQCYKTKYYHVVCIDSLIANGGKWIGCPYSCHNFRKGGYKALRVGVSHVDWKITELKQLVH